MTKRQLNRLQMYGMVRAFLEEFRPKLEGTAMYATLLAKLDKAIKDIDEAVDYQVNGARGKTAAKNSAIEHALQLVNNVSGVLHAYASSIGDQELLAKTNTPKGVFLHMRYSDQLRLGNIIYTEALAVADKLAPYWYDDTSLEALRKALDEASAATGKRDTSVDSRTTVRKSLPQLFRIADTIIKHEVDAFLEQFISTDHALAFRYAAARQVKWIGMKRPARKKSAKSAEASTGNGKDVGAGKDAAVATSPATPHSQNADDAASIQVVHSAPVNGNGMNGNGVNGNGMNGNGANGSSASQSNGGNGTATGASPLPAASAVIADDVHAIPAPVSAP